MIEDSPELEIALTQYKFLKEKLRKIPSAKDFFKIYSRRKLEKLFTGGNLFSQLQKLVGDAPRVFSVPKSSLEDILIKWGDLARETLVNSQKLPRQSDWAYSRLSPTVSGLEKSHKIKWSELPALFRTHFSEDSSWNDILQNIPIDNTDSSVSYSPDREECFVYLMHDLRNDCYKIGIASNPTFREKTLQSEQPKIKKITEKKYINRKIAGAIEKALHNVYAHKHKRGEWFLLDSEDIFELKATLS